MDQEQLLAMLARIDVLLTKKEISRSTFYSDIGITAGAFSQWKKGITSPRMKSVEKIADYLGVSVDYLIDGENRMAVTPSSNSHSNESIEAMNLIDAQPPAERKRLISAIRALCSQPEGD